VGALAASTGVAWAQVPWPAQTWGQGQDLTAPLQTELSGACYNGTVNYILAISQNEFIWPYTYNAALQLWTTVGPVVIPINGDYEGITQFDETTDPVDGVRVLLLNEGTGGGTHNDSFVYYFRRLTTLPTLARTWRVGCAAGCPMPGEADNLLGPEGIAFVPNAWLAARGFVDAAGLPRLGTPRAANGLGGLVLIGHQWTGFIYAFDLKLDADHAMNFVGIYDTGSSHDEIAGLEFDATNGLLYVFHGAGVNFLEVTDLSSTPAANGGANRVFLTRAWTTPADGGAALNLEGLAVIPPEMCAAHDVCAGGPAAGGSIFLTCDACTPAFKWMQGLSASWIHECPPGCPSGPAGDMNCDGMGDGRDIEAFVSLLLSGAYACQSDLNRDRVVDGADVAWFAGWLVGQ